MTTLLVICGAMVGAGVVGLTAATRPRRLNLAASVDRWNAGRERAARDRITHPLDQGPLLDRASWALVEQLGRRGHELTATRADLAICERTLESHFARIIVALVLGLLMPPVLGLLAYQVGIGVPLTLPLIAGLAVAGVLVIGTNRQLHAAAEERRDELRWALSSYQDLVSMCLGAGQGIPQALPAAARVGRGWAFELLSRTLERATLTGDTPATAMTRLGHRLAVSDLVDLGSALALSGTEGAKASESLGARASSLRQGRLSEDQARANQASKSMTLPEMLLAGTFLGFLAYPAISVLLSSAT